MINRLTSHMSTQYISIQEAAELTDKSIQTIRRGIKAKKFKFKKSKTPQGFNYNIDKESLCEHYSIPFKKEEEKSETIEKKEDSTKEVSKKEESSEKKSDESTEYINADDFKRFTESLERMVSQHSEERQNFLRLVNTLQEKIFVLENQLKLLQEPPKKKWYQLWK